MLLAPQENVSYDGPGADFGRAILRLFCAEPRSWSRLKLRDARETPGIKKHRSASFNAARAGLWFPNVHPVLG